MKTITRWIVLCLTVASLPSFPLLAAEVGRASFTYNCNMNGTPFQGTNYVQLFTEEDRRTMKRWNPENGICHQNSTHDYRISSHLPKAIPMSGSR